MELSKFASWLSVTRVHTDDPFLNLVGQIWDRGQIIEVQVQDGIIFSLLDISYRN